MSTAHMPPRPPTAGGPLIPTPPPAMGKRRNRPLDLQWLIWAGAFLVGIGLGVTAYQWVPNVDFYFDYWISLALS